MTRKWLSYVLGDIFTLIWSPWASGQYLEAFLAGMIGSCDQGCQIFLGAWHQSWKKCTKWTHNVLSGHRISQMFIKYSKRPLKYINILQSETVKSFPRLGFWVWKQTIWQPCARPKCCRMAEKSFLCVNKALKSNLRFESCSLYSTKAHWSAQTWAASARSESQTRLRRQRSLGLDP
jgi:hypothetical protein